MVLGKGSTTVPLTTADVQQLLAAADEELLVGAGLDPWQARPGDYSRWDAHGPDTPYVSPAV